VRQSELGCLNGAVFGENDTKPYRARIAVYARARKTYEKAIASSEAQRVKDEAIAFAAIHATNEVLSAPAAILMPCAMG
jgi:hypothetical protein